MLVVIEILQGEAAFILTGFIPLRETLGAHGGCGPDEFSTEEKQEVSHHYQDLTYKL
jgi:hypothetical protein